MEEMEKNSDITEKKSHKGVFCAIIIVLLLGLIGFGYYYKNKPDVIFKTATNKIYKEFKLNTANSKSKVDFDMAFNVSVDGKSEIITEDVKGMLDLVNNLLFKFSIYEDMNSNIYKLDLGADYKNKELVNVDAYYENKKVYVDLNDLFDKVISADVDLEEYTNKFSKDDMKVLVDEYFNALNKALDKAKYVSEKVELNGSKVTRNKLVINDENKDAIVKALIDYLKNSDKFIKVIAKISGEKESEIKEALSEEFDIPKLETSIVLSIYTKGLNNETVKMSVAIDEKELVTITQTSKNNYEMVMSEDGIEFKCNIKSESDTKAQAVCSVNVENVKMSYTMNVNVDRNPKLEKPNVANAVSYEELKEEDVSKIMENLTNKEAIKEIYGAVGPLMESFSGEVEVEPVEENEY